MIAKLWIGFQIFIIGCVTIEVGVFLRKLDENLTVKLANPHLYNSSQLFQDVAAYSFNIGRLLRLFKLKREQVMEAAKWLHSLEHPLFIRNFSCEKVKSDFQLSEREYKDLLNFMGKITKTLNDFYIACEENKEFVGVPISKPVFSLDKHALSLESMFKIPDPSIKKYKILKTVEDYYYTLGKFTKKFILGRKAVMERAKVLFESGGPSFLKYYDCLKLERTYRFSASEIGSLDNLIHKIRKRYEQFTTACYKNPNFECKIDFSSITIIHNCETVLRDILSNPSANFTTLLFKQVKDFYRVLGFLRRYNISHRFELLRALFELFSSNCPTVLQPLDFDRIKTDFQLSDEMVFNLKEYIGHLRRRFHQVQQAYLNISGSSLINNSKSIVTTLTPI